MRIAILTFHRAYNCGAMLQAWALQTVLQRMGHEVEFPDVNHVGETFRVVLWRSGLWGKIRNFLGWVYVQYRSRGVDLVRKFAFGRFMDKELNHKKFNGWDRYDLIVVGSDQVWNPRCVGMNDFPLFLGQGIDPKIPMVGYAVSAGDGDIPGDEVKRLRNAAKRFSALSFREPRLRDLLASNGPIVCDPTLLLRRTDYTPIECGKKLGAKPFLFVYAVSDVRAILPKARAVAEHLGLRLIVADVYRRPGDKSAKVRNNCWALSPDRLLAYIRDADCVIVSSFHGCVFSILYQKRFACLYGENTGGNEKMGRQQNLLARLGLLDHRLSSDAPVADVAAALTSAYRIDGRLDAMTRESMEYLRAAVENA